MRLVLISDTHNEHDLIDIPDGDILIHAGDFTERGSIEEVEVFNEFLGSLPHKHKLVIAGNHEFAFERFPEVAKKIMTNCTYLFDNAVIIDGIKFYGSPWQPWFYGWAFNLERGKALADIWNKIDLDTEVLITHTPPLGHGDKVISGEKVGCEELICYVDRIRPKYHVFGHIHDGYGVTRNQHTTFINASTFSGNHIPENEPIIIDI